MGREDARKLGEVLRKRYVEDLRFIAGYSPDAVYVRSTNITRTVESARLLLTGLFGASGLAIRVVTTADEKETLYPNTNLCPRLGEMFRAASRFLGWGRTMIGDQTVFHCRLRKANLPKEGAELKATVREGGTFSFNSPPLCTSSSPSTLIGPRRRFTFWDCEITLWPASRTAR